MRIAIAQMNTRAGDFQTTCERIREASTYAMQTGCSLLVVGACTLCGNMAPDAASVSGFCLDMASALHELDGKLDVATLVPILSDDVSEPTLDVALLGPHVGDGPQFVEGPASLSGEEAADRLRWLVADGSTFAVACTYEDLGILRDAADYVDAVLFISTYPYAFDDVDSSMGAALTENRFRVDARDLSAWVAGIASLGGYDRQVYCGSSFVVSPTGDLVAGSAAFEETVVVADLFDECDSAAPLEVFDPSLHLWEALSLSMRDYLGKMGRTGVSLVLDGTLGSSILATLAADAVGPAHVHVLIAPSSPSGDGQDLACARELAHALHVNMRELSGSCADDAEDLARFRDLIALELASLSRETDSVALGHADKTGLALEPGNGGCRAYELLPIGDVYRSDVLDLAHMRNTVSPIIPRYALTSYEVPDVFGQEEGELGAETRLRRIDAVLSSHIEWVRNATDVVSRHGDRAVTERVLALLRDRMDAASVFPDVLAMSTRTLADCRLPHGMAWRDRVRERDEQLELSHRRDIIEQTKTGPVRAPLELLSGNGAEVAELIGRMETDVLSSLGQEGNRSREVSEVLSNLFGLLEDLAQSGALTMGEDISGHPEMGMGWMGPFSEN